MRTIHSKYLNKDFQVNIYEKDENGRTLSIITHDSLEDIIHNQIESGQVVYDYELVKISPEHCVAKCVISDKQRRRIVAIGESKPSTLETEIAANYPATIATQRAFGRAVIRYLILPGKVFSNLEIPDTQINNTMQQPNKQQTQQTMQQGQTPQGRPGLQQTGQQMRPKSQQAGQRQVRQLQTRQMLQGNPNMPNMPQQNMNVAQTNGVNSMPQQQQKQEQDPGQMKIVRGTCKGLTIREAFERDISSVAWLVNNMSGSTTKDVQEMLANIHAYMEANPSAKQAFMQFAQQNAQ